VVHAVDSQPGEQALDVATGTGAVAVRLRRAGAEVTGVDLAPALVETARRLAAEDGLEVR
jgi:2-polyprenyl-3-methyl-5-hydroxy-6-metoxy-1,4-benzoquinol methylase